MNEEKFGHIKIDKTPEQAGWTAPVPYLDYWRVKDVKALNREQNEFYNFLKECIKTDKVIKGYNINPYLLLLRDELIQKSTKAKERDNVVETINKLKNAFDFSDFSLNEILKKEAERQRTNRLYRYRRGDTARWIAIGETIEVDGKTLTRGGFYLGTHLNFSRYDTKEQTFHKSATPVEGPVVNLTEKIDDESQLAMKSYHTYLEMPQSEQDKLLGWLGGNDTNDRETLSYYLSGIEFRLLGDRDTTDAERADILRHLINQILPILEGNDRPYGLYMLRQSVIKLIDYTLARFFTYTAETIIPEKLRVQLPILLRARIAGYLATTSQDEPTNQPIVKVISSKLQKPRWLPESMFMTYRHWFETKAMDALTRNNPWHDPTLYRYTALKSSMGYEPDDTIIHGFNQEATATDSKNIRNLERITYVLQDMEDDLKEFYYLNSIGGTPIALARKAPNWCDPKEIPGFTASIKRLLPDKGQEISTIKLSELIDFLGIRYMFTGQLDTHCMEQVNFELYKFGLRTSTSLIRGTKLNPDETIAMYDRSYGDVSTRGTMAIGLYLAAWMISADKVTEHHLNIIDQWIDGAVSKDRDAVPAKAALRWLISHKLTLSTKRKSKATAITKYPKKRDELLHLLLKLVADPESATPKRMTRLRSIYDLIGLNPDDIHSDLHRLSTTKQTTAKKAGTTTTIDRTRLKDMTANTVQAQKILSAVFSQDNDADISATVDTDRHKELTEDPTIQILRLFKNKVEWTRQEFEDMSKGHGETVGSMLERLNDYSYDYADEAIAEDDDDHIYIDSDVLDQLISKN